MDTWGEAKSGSAQNITEGSVTGKDRRPHVPQRPGQEQQQGVALPAMWKNLKRLRSYNPTRGPGSPQDRSKNPVLRWFARCGRVPKRVPGALCEKNGIGQAPEKPGVPRPIDVPIPPLPPRPKPSQSVSTATRGQSPNAAPNIPSPGPGDPILPFRQSGGARHQSDRRPPVKHFWESPWTDHRDRAMRVARCTTCR